VVYKAAMFWILPWALTVEIGLFVVLIFLIQLEKFGWSTFLVVASVVTYSIVGHYLKWPKVSEVFSRDNFWLVLQYIGYYLVGAVVWSYGKWVFFLFEFRRIRDKAVESFKANLKLNPERYHVQGELTIDDIRRNLGGDQYKRTYLSSSPAAKDYKAMIVAWAIWWPASLIGTLLDDPIRKFLNFLFDRFSSLYQKAADRIVPEIRL
jgi:hypothetical protein